MNAILQSDDTIESKQFARNFWRELDWQMPETLIRII